MHNNEFGINIGIVGARGYSGIELARNLLRHPLARLQACFASRDSKFSLSNYLPDTLGSQEVPTLELEDIPKACKKLDTIFLATPTEVSMELAPQILASGCNVIDLSGAFRLDVKSFEDAYGMTHSCPELLDQAHYGLVPWAGPISRLGGAVLVSNPGCYATSVLMAILPLLKSGLIQSESLVIDAKSGTTGAGRKAAENLIFSEVSEDLLPYRVGRHQHLPEIRRHGILLSGASDTAVDPWFTTHLMNVSRGISSGIYARLRSGSTLADVQEVFQNAYASYPLLKHAPITAHQGPPLNSLKRVVGSARTHISYTQIGERLYLFSLIDNLLKGAATQAIENFNLLHDAPAELGLIQREVVQ